MTRKIGAVLLFALWIIAVHAQSADSSKTGVLTGSTLDSNHVPIPAVKVRLQVVGRTDSITAETDAAGVYRFELVSGTYSIHADKGEKGEASAGPFTVERNKTTTINLVLQPSSVAEPQFFDEPQFTVAGVADNTYRGGHGSDTVLRSAETLAKATASLGNSSPDASAAEPHHALGKLDENSGHPLDAIKEFQRAAELNPSEPNLFDWGAEFLVHRTPQPAVEVFTKGVQRYPQSVRMLLGLGTAWYASGSYEQAAECFFKATDLDPGDPKPYVFLTKVQAREITDSPGYEERLARFARLHPDSALANYSYAVSLWNRREGPEGSRMAEKMRALLYSAVKIDPRFASAYLQLGIVDASERRYPEAIRELQKAVDANPELEEAHYCLAEAYRITGDRMKAGQELALYSQLSKSSAAKVEDERRSVQQFVISLRGRK